MAPLHRQAIQQARAGKFVATPPMLRALKKYAANSRNQLPREAIDTNLSWFGSREWPVDPEYSSAQQDRIWGLCLLSDGKTFRNNRETRKLGARERAVIAGLHTFTFVGMHRTVLDYDTRNARTRGVERATDVHPVFRAYGAGAYFEFIYRPWQSHWRSLNVGFTVLASGEGNAP